VGRSIRIARHSLASGERPRPASPSRPVHPPPWTICEPPRRPWMTA
jgi:hypothetical protein